MRDMAPLICLILALSTASCSRRPTDQRVDVKTTLLPELPAGDKAFSGYQPAKAYADTGNGLLARTIFEAAAAAGARIEVTDWKLAPGKQSTPITLPGAAFIEVRSGSGTLQAGDRTQQLQPGTIIPVSQDQPFTIANSGQFTLTMRVSVVRGS